MKKILSKKHLEALKKGQEKNKAIFIFEDNNYKIEKIPLNYKITIKCAKRNLKQKIENDWYSNLSHGIKEAYSTAEFAMEEYFIKDKKPEIPKHLKKNLMKNLKRARKCIGK